MFQSMQSLLSDLLQASRTLIRSPRFSLLAVLTLSLGLAAAITIFSVANGVLIRPLHYSEPDQLVHLRGDSEAGRFALSFPDYADISDGLSELKETAAWQGWQVKIRDSSGVLTVSSAASVTSDFFQLLGAEPALGRFFGPEDSRPGESRSVVISHDLWQETYSGRRDVLGQELKTEDGTYQIIGVAASSFEDPVAAVTWGSRPQVWRAAPAYFDRSQADRSWNGFWAIGRLDSSGHEDQAQAHLAAISAQLRRDFPSANPERQFNLLSFREARVGSARSTVFVLLASVIALLLIACANVSNLLLTRGASRERELAVRAALGAPRYRLMLLMLHESFLLSAISSVLGLTLSWLASDWLLSIARQSLPRLQEVQIDANVVLFAFAAAVVTTLTAGAVPALRITGKNLVTTLRSGDRGGSSARQTQRIRAALIVFETAAAVVLLLMAGLLLKTLWKLHHEDLGLERGQLLTLSVYLPSEMAETPARHNAYLDSALQSLQQFPAIQNSGFVSNLPLSGTEDSTIVIPDGLPPPANPEAWRALVRAVTPEYFATVGIPVLRGRSFQVSDQESSEPVAIVNRVLAARILGSDDPIDQLITVRGTARRIIGIVDNVKHFGPQGELRPALYEPYAQVRQNWMRSRASLVLRVAPDSSFDAAPLRPLLAGLASDISVGSLRTMDEMFQAQIAGPRLRAFLLGVFAAAALALAAVGIAGLIAYNVSCRFREIAIRLALGADRGRVLRLFLREAALLSLAGLLIGVAIGAALSQLVNGFLFAVDPLDPEVIALAVLTLLLAALAASYFPARRALTIDPAEVLRSQ